MFSLLQPSVSRDTDVSLDDAAALALGAEAAYAELVQPSELESVDGSIIIDWDQVDDIIADVQL